ncbi:MAG: DEAD/DEAH box helicase family protein [Humidesulfovibrio sp.]|uniref:DEAD/DEAH box helicase family protein n=1 Tax=Humidesulfovibrio sp. TaxID=2910988 RepID=UPI002733836C|nr:DEAD/DEAH box helicase family protein [Humidesulfovibrio sp.]MDP2847531.1 DEAD/DEAH box helicase family protein [Humidesulfovibrio sp.]
MSNFTFLQSEWPSLYEAATKAEGLVSADPRTSCFYSRRALELAVSWLYKHDKTFKLPYKDNLNALINEPSFRQNVGGALFTKAKFIKDLGNMAAHSTRKLTPSDSLNAAKELFHLCYWVARTYSQKTPPDPAQRFSVELVQQAAPAPPLTPEQLQQIETKLQEKDEKLSAVLADKVAVDEELQKLRELVAATKKANAGKPDPHDYSEAETRDLFIDLLLKEAGWEIGEKNLEIEVLGMPNNQGKGYVDYVLWGDDGKPLALIEAKRTKKDPKIGQQQAKLYADCLEKQFGQRPVIFLSNGYDHWIWDDASYPPRAIQGFYKKDELELIIQRRTSKKRLSEAVIKAEIVERYYQTRAIRRIGESFEKDHMRKALVVMATGAGKTRTVIALADMLMRCNWVKRVLFLADRVALVRQAVNAFKKHLPDSAPVNLVTEKNTDGRVYVSTYPTMMGLIDSFDAERKFGVGHFDLIVIDEAHRSVYQKYRAIFEYFDSFLVGLTATPKDEIDHNTYSLFDLETGVPTDAYALDVAVADGHLVPPQAVSVPLKFQREGIKYDELSEEEKEQWDALEWGEEGTIPEVVDPAALNKWLFNEDTVDKVLKHLMERGQKVAGGDRLGKTIIFAKNNHHADFIAERFNASYPHYKGHFARVVTYKTEYAQNLIDDFSNKDKAPHIAISVDMLDTGIDVPEVVNLAFFKAVRSKTKFWQMIGRGTRLCPDLFGPGENKKFFYLFDYCQNLEFFSQNPDVTEGASTEPLGTRLFKTRLELIEELTKRQKEGDDTTAPLKEETIGFLQGQVAAMNLDNFVVRPQRKAVEKFAQAGAWKQLSKEDYDDLATKVSRLPTEAEDTDEDAKRFDLMILRVQLAVLKADKSYEGYRDQIRAIASALESQEAIPAIKAQISLIQEMAGEEWWTDVTVPMLETARKKLRALVKLIEKGKKKIVYTDFEDEFGEETTVELTEVKNGLDMVKFKEKARQFLRDHEDNLALQRLRRNLQLTPTDLEELEKMLEQAGGSKTLITKAKEQSQGLGIFIRTLVGLDREAAVEALNELIAGTTATPNQIEFIDLVVQHLMENGIMETERLYKPPFIDINPVGPEGIFPMAKVDLLVSKLEEIRKRAAA